jgi:septum formation topological specificity factor MinE
MLNLRRFAHDWAKARAEVTYLEEFRKAKLAMLMKKAEVDGHKTAAAQEREAYADPEYMEFLKALKIATEAEARLRYEVKVLEASIEVWRTQQANERLERRGYDA